MENTIVSSFFQAGPFGKFILITIFLLSIYIWTIIQSKYFIIKNIMMENKFFLKEYKKLGKNIFQPIENEERYKFSTLYRLFNVSKNELIRIMEEERSLESMDIEVIANELSKTVSQTKVELDEGIVALATATSIAPFLGLLGTVWGIMNAFFGMSKMGNASIDAVAPGIAEALIATAVGLMVAIPASIAYNFSKSRIQLEITTLNNFAVELLDDIEKKFINKNKR